MLSLAGSICLLVQFWRFIGFSVLSVFFHKLFLFDVAFKQVSWLFLVLLGCMIIWSSNKVITTLIKMNITKQL